MGLSTILSKMEFDAGRLAPIHRRFIYKGEVGRLPFTEDAYRVKGEP